MQKKKLKMVEVPSSNLWLLGFDQEKMMLDIVFRSSQEKAQYTMYTYRCSLRDLMEMLLAPSMGSWFHANLRDGALRQRLVSPKDVSIERVDP